MLLLSLGIIAIGCFIVVVCAVANGMNRTAAEDDAQEANIREWKAVHGKEQKRKTN